MITVLRSAERRIYQQVIVTLSRLGFALLGLFACASPPDVGVDLAGC